MKVPDMLAMYGNAYKAVCVEAEKVCKQNSLENNKAYKLSLVHFLALHHAIMKELEKEIEYHLLRTCKAIDTLEK